MYNSFWYFSSENCINLCSQAINVLLISLLKDNVNPESVQFVESAIQKLHGSLIPVDTLVQTNRRCIVNIFCLWSSTEAGHLPDKQTTTLMGVIPYTSVLEYHLKQQQSSQSSSMQAQPSQTKCRLMSNGKVFQFHFILIHFILMLYNFEYCFHCYM